MAKNVAGWDPDKLTPEQAQIAEMIIAESRRQGVNPNIVLPMAWLESNWDQNATSKTGARGVMQITKGAAKTYDCDRENVGDNIRCGVKIIDDLLKNNQVGYDPLKLVVAYHDGPNSAYFKTGNKDDISEEAVKYAHSFNLLSGGLLKPEVAKSAEATTDQPSGSPDLEIRESIQGINEARRQQSGEDSPEYGFSPDAMLAGATTGLPAGAAV